MARFELAHKVGASLGESPIWDVSTQRLYHVDINGKTLYAWSPRTRCAALEPLRLPALVGAVVPRASGGLLACLEVAVVPVEPDSMVVGEPLATVPFEHRGPSKRFNDCKCDARGRLYAGTMHSEWRDPKAPAGQLYLLHGAAQPLLEVATAPSTLAAATVAALAASAAVGSYWGRTKGVLAMAASAALTCAAVVASTAAFSVAPPPPLETLISDARLPNGMAWSADGKTMFWIDSFTQRVDAFDVAADGSLANRRAAVRVPARGAGVHGAAGGIPDGMTIDAQGKLWVTLAEWGVAQYDPETGAQLCALQLPVKRPTACTFGGADLSELYVTTREEGPSGSPGAGGLFRVHVPGVKGLAGAYAFQG